MNKESHLSVLQAARPSAHTHSHSGTQHQVPLIIFGTDAVLMMYGEDGWSARHQDVIISLILVEAPARGDSTLAGE